MPSSTHASAGRRVFAHPGRRVALQACLMALPLGALVPWLVPSTTPAEAFATSIVALFVLGLLSRIGFAAFFRDRPIAFSDEKIEALIAGRPWRTIEWRDMGRIERSLVVSESEDGSVNHYELIVFCSGRRTIMATSFLPGYETLKQLATERAKRRLIPLVLVEPQSLMRPPVLTPLDEL
jgi:hypothetical protein